MQAVAEAAGFSVVREYTGHGIGTAMHEQPDVPNWGKPGKGRKLAPGQTFAVEPMVCAGRPDDPAPRRRAGPWSPPTAACAAHAEHTIAITDDGPEILTLP